MVSTSSEVPSAASCAGPLPPEAMGRTEPCSEYALALWALAIFDFVGVWTSPGGHALLWSAMHAISLIALSARTARRLWSTQRASVLSPLTLVLIFTIAFHGIGVLFYNLADPASLDWVDRHYAVTDRELLRVNLAIAVGLALLWTAASVVLGAGRPRVGRQHMSAIDEDRLAILLFVIGFGVQFGLVVPYVAGWRGGVRSGAVMMLASVMYAAIFLLALRNAENGGKKFRLLLPTALALGVFSGILTTSKTNVILTLLVFVLGRFFVRLNWKQVVAGAGSIALVYVTLAPFVLEARTGLASVGTVTPMDTVRVLADALASDSPDETEPRWWLLRLSYVAPQAYAMASYDSGSPGDTINGDVVSVLIPRALWPNKPVRAQGRLFSDMYGGNPNSSLSPGIFAEGYWNGGWPGLMLVSISAGVLLGVAHRFVTVVLHQRTWIMLPLVVGLFLGLSQINGFFGNAFVYAPATQVGMQLVIGGVFLLLHGRVAKRARGSRP